MKNYILCAALAILLGLPTVYAQTLENSEDTLAAIHEVCSEVVKLATIFAYLKYDGTTIDVVIAKINGPEGDALGNSRGLAREVALTTYQYLPVLPVGQEDLKDKFIENMRNELYIACYTDGLKTTVKEES